MLASDEKQANEINDAEHQRRTDFAQQVHQNATADEIAQPTATTEWRDLIPLV